MSLIIGDPSLWARTNGYALTSISSDLLAVSNGGQRIGVLKAGGRGYVFEGFTPAASAPVVEETGALVSHSFGLGLSPIEMHKMAANVNEIPLSSKVSGTGQSERASDCNYWLPYAAEHYQISRDIRDYVLVPVPALFSALPNTNGDSLSLGELLRFDTSIGLQMYKTFKGMPTYEEHANKDITKAKGVILDCFLRPIAFNPRYYKVVQLLAFDRTKDAELVRQILSREHNAYSVGFYYSSYACSICNSVVGKGLNLVPCAHTKLGRPTYRYDDGRLAYRKCRNGKGFECSVVRTPAYVSNIGTHVMDAAACY